MAKPKTTKTISLLVDHVYMPTDLLSGDWEIASDTARYEAKAAGSKARFKYVVHPGLADYLVGRDQALEVPTEGAEGGDTE
jgi:hypothetical protein